MIATETGVRFSIIYYHIRHVFLLSHILLRIGLDEKEPEVFFAFRFGMITKTFTDTR